jgi:hypothetical protein
MFEVTNRQYVLAILKVGLVQLAWGLLLVLIIEKFSLDLGGEYRLLKWSCFLVALLAPVRILYRGNLLQEYKKRRAEGRWY